MNRSLLFFCLFSFVLAGCSAHRLPPEVCGMLTYEGKGVPQRKELIAIDAGHGGRDAGTASRKEDYEEKSLTLSTVFLLQEELKNLGYKTLLTRNHDTYVPLNMRAELANAAHADLFVSVHYNFSSSREVQGIEVYYYKEEKQPTLARIVKSKALAQKVLGSVIAATQAGSRGIKQANFAVIRETVMPAILIEAGFLSNRQERERLRDPIYLRQLTKGIAAGVNAYITQ